MKRRASLTLIITILFFFICSNSVLAASLYLNVPGTAQEDTNWCWAASSVCVLNYQNKGVTQTQFVTYVKGSPVNEAGWPWEVSSGLSHWNVNSNWTLGSVSWGTILDNIGNNYAPIIASIAWAPLWQFKGHMVTIYGYYEDPYVRNISYMDPDGVHRWKISTFPDFVTNASFIWSGTNYNLSY